MGSPTNPCNVLLAEAKKKLTGLEKATKVFRKHTIDTCDGLQSQIDAEKNNDKVDYDKCIRLQEEKETRLKKAGFSILLTDKELQSKLKDAKENNCFEECHRLKTEIATRKTQAMHARRR